MLRKLLLPMLATAVLAGCATDYRYRGGQGDYYYGQPHIEYRRSGAAGFYGDLGYGLGGFGYGFGATFFYDRHGRLVYGSPGNYYGFPYYGRGHWYPHRPHRGNGDGRNQQGDGDKSQEVPPPWRDLGRYQQRDSGDDIYRNREARERLDQPARSMSRRDAPMRAQRPSPDPRPAMPERSRPPTQTDGLGHERNNRERRVKD